MVVISQPNFSSISKTHLKMFSGQKWDHSSIKPLSFWLQLETTSIGRFTSILINPPDRYQFSGIQDIFPSSKQQTPSVLTTTFPALAQLSGFISPRSAGISILQGVQCQASSMHHKLADAAVDVSLKQEHFCINSSIPRFLGCAISHGALCRPPS